MAIDRRRNAARQRDPGTGRGTQAAGGSDAGIGRAAGARADGERGRVGGNSSAGRCLGGGSSGADSGRSGGDARRGAAPGSSGPGAAGAGGCDRRAGGIAGGASVRAGAPAHAGGRRGVHPRAGPSGGRGAGAADGGVREAAGGGAGRGDGVRAGQRARTRGSQRTAPADDQPVQLPGAAQGGLRRPGGLQPAAAVWRGCHAGTGGGGAPDPESPGVVAGTAGPDAALAAADSRAGVPQLHTERVAGIQRPADAGRSDPGAGRGGL